MWTFTAVFICICLLLVSLLGTINLILYFIFNIEYQIEKFICWVNDTKRATPLAKFIVKMKGEKFNVFKKERRETSKRNQRY